MIIEFITRTNYKAGSKTQDPREVENGIYQSTLIKVLVDYSQIVGLISTIKVKWPGFVTQKFSHKTRLMMSVEAFRR